MEQKVIKPIALSLGGDTYSLDVKEPFDLYLLTGSGTLSGSIVVQPANTEESPFPLDGDNKGVSFSILYNANLVIGANNITFFGRALTAQEALVDCLIYATYNGSSFVVQVIPNFATLALWITSGMFAAGSVNTAALAALGVTTEKINDLAVTSAKIGSLSITTGKLALLAVTAAQIATGTITTTQIANATITGGNIALGTIDTANMALLSITTALIAAKAVTTAKVADGAIDTLQIADNAVTLAKILDGIITAAKLTTSLATEVISATISFAAGRTGTYQVLLPYACTVKGVFLQVTDAIAGTDNGQVQLQNDAGTVMTDGTLAVTMSSAFGVGFTITPTANNSFTAGQKLKMAVSKTTAGGEMQVFVTVQRT